MLHCDAPGVAEVAVGYVSGVHVVHADVHVQACLYVVLGCDWFFQLLCSLASSVGKGLVTGWYPAALHSCSLFFISLVFSVLAEEGGDGSYCFLVGDLSVVACCATFHKLGLGSASAGLLAILREPSFVL